MTNAVKQREIEMSVMIFLVIPHIGKQFLKNGGGDFRNLVVFRQKGRYQLPLLSRKTTKSCGKEAFVIDALRNGDTVGYRFARLRSIAFQCVSF